MPHQHALHTILNLQVNAAAPGIAVYAQEVSNRLRYVCDFIFGHVLKTKVLVTANRQEWEHTNFVKINYSPQSIPDSFHIIPQGLLFETGVREQKPVPFFKNGKIYFFESGSVSEHTFPFDVFSAVFYFISRYEEWQPFERDNHGRFEAAASLLYQHGQHLTPVVDNWIYELKAALEKHYPTVVFPETQYKIISTIDVDNLYAYRAKGLVRTLGGSLKDLLKLDVKNLGLRLQTVFGLKPDPFDIYDTWAQFCQEQHIPLIFFFLFRTGTTYDRTVNPNSPAFKRVFAILRNRQALAGLHPSYDSAFEKGLMEKEAETFSEKYGESVTFSRQHFLRFDIRSTPQLLMQQGIVADFSMGFASSVGFRAGTSHPFYYYDLHSETQQELLFVPFCAMDGAYFVYNAVDPETASASLFNLAEEVKKVNGLFVTLFHERTFFNHLYPGFGTLYKNLHLRLKDNSWPKN